MSLSDDKRVEMQVEVWKKTIDVQQHFNDLEMRIRALALTVLTAALGAAALAVRYSTAIDLWGLKLQLATIVLLGSLVVWGAFYFVDQIWYHRLLIGAVRHGETIEEILAGEVPGVKLSSRISEESPYIFKWWPGPNKPQIHSRHKLSIFYAFVAIALIVIAAVTQLGTSSSAPVSDDPKPTPTSMTSTTIQAGNGRVTTPIVPTTPQAGTTA